MDEMDRLEIVKSLEMVDEVFLSIDTDKSVCASLEAIKPDNLEQSLVFGAYCILISEFFLKYSYRFFEYSSLLLIDALILRDLVFLISIIFALSEKSGFA